MPPNGAVTAATSAAAARKAVSRHKRRHRDSWRRLRGVKWGACATGAGGHRSRAQSDLQWWYLAPATGPRCQRPVTPAGATPRPRAQGYRGGSPRPSTGRRNQLQHRTRTQPARVPRPQSSGRSHAIHSPLSESPRGHACVHRMGRSPKPVVPPPPSAPGGCVASVWKYALLTWKPYQQFHMVALGHVPNGYACVASPGYG
jgi:hypothetical protein